ncbi:MAG: glycosyltransferase family 4 protein [Anaerolineae bacterium]
MRDVSRIGIDARELARGARTGIGRFLREVLRAGGSLDECEFVLYGNGTTWIEPTGSNVQVRVVGGKWTQWWDQVSLPRQLARDRVAVFLSPYYKCPILAPCPVVLTIHDLFFIHYPGQRRPFHDIAMTALARLYASRATTIIADSEYSKRSIVDRLGVNPAKVTVIPVALGPEFKPAPLTDAVRHRYGIPAPYILYVGNFKPHKNLPRLLRAYAGLPDPLRATYQLVLAGGDRNHQPGLEDLARSLEVADRILFPGLIADSDLPALYSGSALFILPSLDEGFGLPALEAMACGAPVVASDRAALPEVVGAAALLVDPEDEAAITKAIARTLTADDIREDLRRRGLDRAREFSPDRTAGRILELLREVGKPTMSAKAKVAR